MKADTCMCCRTKGNDVFDNIDGYDYFECRGCGSIFIDSNVLSSMDHGESIVEYNEEYWEKELGAARERSYGQSLARVSEVLLYARTPVRRFIDIGTGSGYLLDALAFFLPSATDKFHGIEKFPPEKGHSSHPNYHVGTLGEAPGRFQAGTCIEVVEHLTPKMLRQLFIELKEKSEDNAIFLFNTGLSDYVRQEDRGYLDPTIRGHVFSYSLKAVEMLSADLGFTVLPLKGRTWAFLVEYKSSAEKGDDLYYRVWTAPQENRDILCDPQTGSVLYALGVVSAREHTNVDAILRSTSWRVTAPLRALKRGFLLLRHIPPLGRTLLGPAARLINHRFR